MWQIGGRQLQSRLLLGSAKYPNPEVLRDAIGRSGTQIVTVSLRRQSTKNCGENYWQLLRSMNVHFLPNTAGCRSAHEAITTAQMAREVFDTHWIKLETVGDDYTLQPDPFALLEAARVLCNEGFVVFPYTTEDLVVCERLLDVGCRILMPWGSPIGSGQGLTNVRGLKTLRARFPEAQLIVDAGIGAPSHAALAMELGFDGVLLNSAVSQANDPVLMAEAFAQAAHAGRQGYLAGLMESRELATPSTPFIGTPFWHESSLNESPL
jgi:thiazole synthase